MVCVAFAIGGPLVCLGVKFSPEEAAKKIPFTMPESKAENDPYAKKFEDMQKKNAAYKAQWESL